MLTKLATAVIYLLVGVGLGYVVWGVRVGQLTESLNHLVLEEDSLQSRLIDTSSSDAQAALAAALDDLSERLRDQSERIAQQAEAIESITGDKSASLQGELSDCADRRARLEHDLEKCLFDKTALERKAKAPVAPPARSGTSPVEKTITFPGGMAPPQNDGEPPSGYAADDADAD